MVAEEKRAKKPRAHPHDALIHEGCGGMFIFLKPECDETHIPIPDERVCSECKKKETYEPNRLMIIGRRGVTGEELIKLYRKYQERRNRLPEESDSEGVPEPCTVTNSRSDFVVLIVTIPDADKERNPELLLEMFIEKTELDELILGIFRKPITR